MKHLRFAVDLLKRHKLISISVILVFLGGILLGFMLPSAAKLMVLKLLFSKIDEMITEDKLINFIRIFINNAFVGLLLIALGFTILLPLAIIFANAMGIGIVIDMFFRLFGLKPSTIAMLLGSILPHGVIEILALLISSIFGVLLGAKLFFRKRIEKKRKLKDLFVKILKIYIIVIIPMFLAAALIESFITPLIGKGLTESLLDERDSNEKLEPLILNQDDFSDLGLYFKEITLNEYMSRFPEIRKFNYLNTIFSLFYNDEIYKEIAQLSNNPGISRIYLNEKTNSTLLIEIMELPADEDAKLWIQASEKILNITLAENNIKSNLIGDHLYKIIQENETFYKKSGQIKKYAYLMTYKGSDIAVFRKLALLQNSKLGNKDENE